MIPVSDALYVLAGVSLFLFPAGFLARGLLTRDQDQADPAELEHNARWDAEFYLPRCMSCGALDCPGLAAVDYCPLWIEAGERAGRGEYLTTRPVRYLDSKPRDYELEGELEAAAEPTLDTGPDRLATIGEIRESGEYMLVWGELGRQVDSARRWYDEAFQTGQFRAVGR